MAKKETELKYTDWLKKHLKHAQSLEKFFDSSLKLILQIKPDKGFSRKDKVYKIINYKPLYNNIFDTDTDLPFLEISYILGTKAGESIIHKSLYNWDEWNLTKDGLEHISGKQFIKYN